jgi:hypothetical protein
MGYAWFFLAVLAACLLWTATLTAAAARTRAGWLRRLLLAVGLVLPAVSLLPWVAVARYLAFDLRLETNWFAPTLTVAIAAAVGAVWIARAGQSGQPPAAAAWPVIGLGAMFVMAKLVAGGTLLFIDNAVTAEARAAQAEATAMMLANLPPVPSDDDNAASLYRRVFADLAADTSEAESEVWPTLEGSPLTVQTESVTDLLGRHRSTIASLRQAADRPACRFTRDWTRPSAGMLLPEMTSLRRAARLLSLAARRAAVDGSAAEAMADVVRLRRLARHAAGEPLLISGLVGMAIDATADETLVAILPTLRPSDLPLLDAEGLLGDPFDVTRWLLGEQAFGLSMFATLGTGSGPDPAGLLANGSEYGAAPAVPTLMLPYRVFLLPSDLAGYRAVMGEELLHCTTDAGDRSWPVSHRRLEDLAARIKERPPGIFTELITPALQGFAEAVTRSQARRKVVAALIAATRHRLETGSLPGSLTALVPGQLAAMPQDPFIGTSRAEEEPLRFVAGSDWLTVYSVGVNGVDDGGPRDEAEGDEQKTDDVGYSMAIR